MDAVRFSPSTNETMKSVQILMASNQGTNQNYSSGTLSVAIWGSKPDGSAPEKSLQQLVVPATRVPQNGLFEVSGFNTTVTAGNDYWIVFSTNSTQHFTFGRLTSPFEFLVLSSPNGGASWYNPSEGPTEYAFTVTLSKETLGTFVAGSVGTSLTANGIFAQPFIVAATGSNAGQRFPLQKVAYGASRANPNTTVDWSNFEPLVGIPAVDPRDVTPYAEHWMLSFERQFGAGTLANLSYIGAESHHLLVLEEDNPADPALWSVTPSANPSINPRAYPSL